MSAFLAVGAVGNVALLVVVVGIVFAKRRSVRRASSRGSGGSLERITQRRYLIENWSSIEEIGVAKGMSTSELVTVRRRLFELETPS